MSKICFLARSPYIDKETQEKVQPGVFAFAHTGQRRGCTVLGENEATEGEAPAPKLLGRGAPSVIPGPTLSVFEQNQESK